MRPLGVCPFCGESLEALDEKENCLRCGAAIRTRSIAGVVQDILIPLRACQATSERPLLAFAMTKNERILLEPLFPRITSVSLFGDYGSGHMAGVDARHLTDFEDGLFGGYFGCLLFDYFTEHEAALREAYRVLAPEGVFFIHIAAGRLEPTSNPPTEAKKIVGTADYFPYLPSGQTLSSVSVGEQWLLDKMEAIGFEARHLQVSEIGTNTVSNWFVGMKPPDGVGG